MPALSRSKYDRPIGYIHTSKPHAFDDGKPSLSPHERKRISEDLSEPDNRTGRPPRFDRKHDTALKAAHRHGVSLTSVYREKRANPKLTYDEIASAAADRKYNTAPKAAERHGVAAVSVRQYRRRHPVECEGMNWDQIAEIVASHK